MKNHWIFHKIVKLLTQFMCVEKKSNKIKESQDLLIVSICTLYLLHIMTSKENKINFIWYPLETWRAKFNEIHLCCVETQTARTYRREREKSSCNCMSGDQCNYTVSQFPSQTVARVTPIVVDVEIFRFVRKNVFNIFFYLKKNFYVCFSINKIWVKK